MLERGGHVVSIAALTGTAVVCWPLMLIMLLFYIAAFVSDARAKAKVKHNDKA